MKKRYLSLLLVMAMALGLLPMQALAADPIHVLALGDSITAGYGLASEAECFTAQLGEGYTVTNKGVSGYKTTDILRQINSGAMDAEIEQADVITLTIGGNDLMALLYARTAELYNVSHDPKIAAADIVALLATLTPENLMDHYDLITCAGAALSRLSAGLENPDYLMNSAEFAAALENYRQALVAITAGLKARNSDAEIIIATQYNPYTAFEGAPSVAPLYDGIEDGANRMNTVITQTAAQAGYTAAPVKAAFDAAFAAGADLYHANPDLEAINLDFHPNAGGHALLAQVFAQVIPQVLRAKAPAEPPVEPPVTEENAGLQDVLPSDYFYDPVLWAVGLGITRGTSDTTFSPNAVCTRAQAVTFLWRALGSPEPLGSEMPFNDVGADAYYCKAVQWAVENGITSGTSAVTFSPEATVTRAQTAAFIYRVIQSMGGGFTGAWMFRLPFTDAPDWAFESIAWCYMNGITKGTSDTTFSPNDGCTRGQIVTFLYRALNN